MFGLSATVTRRSDGSAARPVSVAAVRSRRRHAKPVVTRSATAVSSGVERVTVGSCATASQIPAIAGSAAAASRSTVSRPGASRRVASRIEKSCE